MTKNEIRNIVDNTAQESNNSIDMAKAYSDSEKLSTLTSSDIIQNAGLKADISTLHAETRNHVKKTLEGYTTEQEKILITQAKT